jgi:hypothetical protein
VPKTAAIIPEMSDELTPSGSSRISRVPAIQQLRGIFGVKEIIPLHAGIDAHLVAAVAWRVPPTKTVA